MSNRMNTKLRLNDLQSAGQLACPPVKRQAELPLGEVAAERAKRREAVTSQRNAIVAKWLDAALDRHPKAASIASNCGISEAYLSQMRSGERTIPFHLVLDIIDYSESCAQLLADMARRSGRFGVVELHEVDVETSRKTQIDIIKSIPGLYEMVRRAAAEKLRTTEKSIDWTNEDTDIRAGGIR